MLAVASNEGLGRTGDELQVIVSNDALLLNGQFIDALGYVCQLAGLV
jgi:hypothetical protein